MSLKDWMRHKIRNAAGSKYLEHDQEVLRLELEKRDSAQLQRTSLVEERLAGLGEACQTYIQELTEAQTALRQELKDLTDSQSQRFAQEVERLAQLMENRNALHAALEDSRNALEQSRQPAHTEQEQLLAEICALRDELRQSVDAARGHREYLQSEFNRIGNELHTHVDLVGRDALIAVSRLPVGGNPLGQELLCQVRTDYPIAYSSPDHLHPWGTKNDNTRAPFFIHKCETLFTDKQQLRFADLGCSGGGIVLDALLRGHTAIGLEGSDYSLKHQRAEWRLLKNRLFTCDISKPFDVLDLAGKPMEFDVVSAWEVFEHIPQDGVSQLMCNIEKMLAPGGYLVGTVSQTEDYEPESGASLHLTTQPAEWWYQQAEQAGLVRAEGVFQTVDLARAYGNPPLPWYSNWGCEMSPYIVLQKPLGGQSV